jgi:hypothetical protein
VATAAKNNPENQSRHQKLSQHLQVGVSGGIRNDGIFLSTLNYSAIIVAINETLAMTTATVQSGIGLSTFPLRRIEMPIFFLHPITIQLV